MTTQDQIIQKMYPNPSSNENADLRLWWHQSARQLNDEFMNEVEMSENVGEK